MKKYAIIPAAGAGTRMKELGKNYAKTVLPYEGKPILIHIIESIQRSFNPDFITVVYSNDDHYKQMLNAAEFYGKDVSFWKVEEGRQGPAKSILSGIPYWISHQDDLLIHLSDFVTVNDAALDIEKDSIAAFAVEDQHRWCMVEKDQFVLHDKPNYFVKDSLAVAGIYRFSDAKTFREEALAAEQLGEGEFQISEILSLYNKKIPLSVKEISVNDLKDFGTIEEFIQNRGISKTRSFNDIKVHGNFVTKTSHENPGKLEREYQWYSCVPMTIAQYTPRVFRREYCGYTMELIQSTNLRDLYLYLDRSEETWDEVFSKVYEFIKQCREGQASLIASSSFWESVFDKNFERVAKLPKEVQEEVAPWLKQFHKELQNSRFFGEKTIFHGDLHFANMFYCFHYKQIRVIDPNGFVLGHWFYDLAKLYHSVEGKYDWIDSQLYDGMGFLDRGTDGVRLSFDKMIAKFNLSEEELVLLRKLTASLFLTMIPLHTHSAKNQQLFLEEFRRLK